MGRIKTSILTCVYLVVWVCLAFGQSQNQGAKQQAAIDCSTKNVDYIDDPNMTREERLEAMDRALRKSLGLYDMCQEIIPNGGSTNSGSAGGSGEMTGAGSGEGSGEMAGKDSAKGAGEKSGEMSKAGSASDAEEKDGSVTSGTQNKARNDGLNDGAAVSSVATSDIHGTGGSRNSSKTVGNQEGSASGAEAGTDEQDGQLATQTTGDETSAEGVKPSPQNGSNGNNGAVPEDVKEVDNDSVLEAQIREAAMREKDPEIQARLWNEYRRYKGLPQK